MQHRRRKADTGGGILRGSQRGNKTSFPAGSKKARPRGQRVMLPEGGNPPTTPEAKKKFGLRGGSPRHPEGDETLREGGREPTDGTRGQEDIRTKGRVPKAPRGRQDVARGRAGAPCPTLRLSRLRVVGETASGRRQQRRPRKANDDLRARTRHSQGDSLCSPDKREWAGSLRGQ